MMPVVILAGGEGRRIGGEKPRRLLAGISLLDHAIGLAKRWSPVIAISGRSEATAASEFPYLSDEQGRGPIAGIAAALAFARDRGDGCVLTIPCDTPFLPRDLADRLTSALTPATNMTVAASGGRRHHACALWRTSVQSALSDYLATGDGSLHGFIDTLGGVEVEWLMCPYDPFLNINREADLATAEALIRAR